MHLRSLGYRTDLIFPAFDGEIIDRGHYIVVRTPSNPTFYWGNFLLFSQPAREGDFRTWRDLFAREIGTPPGTEHQAFGWDSPEGEPGLIEPFLQAGFEATKEVVLTTSAPRAPSRPSQSAKIRALESDAEWLQALDLQLTCMEPEHAKADYREFRIRALNRYRRMSVAGLGSWYGAFIGERLVADLGIFHNHDLGRYQSVETHPDFRRQGIAGSMIYEAGRQALAEHGLKMLVIIAEDDSAPERLYRSLGFSPKEKTAGLLWFPHAPQPAIGE
jgi:GNAT superfamily N-acetyltransferase